MQLSMLFFAQLWISIALVTSSSDDSHSSLASFDGFADEFSRIMDSQGTGTTKYKYLAQKHLEIIEMAGPVATKIQEFIKNNTENLLLAWQKLLPVLSKLEHYETVSQPDLDKLPPPQKKSVTKERTRAEWNKFVLVPLNKFQRVLGTHLSTNQTTLSDLPCEGDQNSFNDASKWLYQCCIPYAFASGEIQEYGQEAFDYLHAKFHDALLRVMFYLPFCDAYGGLYDQPYIHIYKLIHNYHKRAVVKFFNKTDSNMDDLLAKNQAIAASEASAETTVLPTTTIHTNEIPSSTPTNDTDQKNGANNGSIGSTTSENSAVTYNNPKANGNQFLHAILIIAVLCFWH